MQCACPVWISEEHETLSNKKEQRGKNLLPEKWLIKLRLHILYLLFAKPSTDWIGLLFRCIDIVGHASLHSEKMNMFIRVFMNWKCKLYIALVVDKAEVLMNAVDNLTEVVDYAKGLLLWFCFFFLQSSFALYCAKLSKCTSLKIPSNGVTNLLYAWSAYRQKTQKRWRDLIVFYSM
jgi:hypothetical protein